MIGQGLELSQTERLACADPSPPGMRSKPHPNQMLKCPRCDSPDTKFCYYNNYSMTQPRYFCKNCKRYWTEGGALRNVPVGGGLRKNKRSKNKAPSNSSSSSSSSEPHHAGVGLHMDGPHLKDYSSFGASHGSPPHDPSEMANFRYTSTPFPEPFHSRTYEAGEQPTLVQSFSFNDMRASPQLYTGYNHLGADGVHQSVEGGYGGYDYVGLVRGEQGQSSCGQASPAVQLISNVGLHQQSMYDRSDNGGEGARLPSRFNYEVGKPHGQDSSRLGREHQEQEGHNNHPCSNELMLLQDSNRGVGAHGGCEEGMTDDGGSVSYPFDWQQVSEGLFAGTGDFYFMSSGGGGSGTGAAPNWSSFNTGTGTGTGTT